jgi:hypothetical protein
MARVVCFRDGERPHLLYRLHIYHGRKGEPKTFSWIDHRDAQPPTAMIASHQCYGEIVRESAGKNCRISPELRAFGPFMPRYQSSIHPGSRLSWIGVTALRLPTGTLARFSFSEGLSCVFVFDSSPAHSQPSP